MRDPAMRPSFSRLIQQFFVEYLGQQKVSADTRLPPIGIPFSSSSDLRKER